MTDQKVFVIAHSGSLLLNYAPGVGFSVEPGSADNGTLS